MPPASTVSKVGPRLAIQTVALVSVPPEMSRLPPFWAWLATPEPPEPMMTVPGYARPPLATPPALTTSVPPAPSLMPLATPPDKIIIVPPAITLSLIAEVACPTPPLAGQVTTVDDVRGATVSVSELPLTDPPLAISEAPEAKVTPDKAPLLPTDMVPPELTVPLVSVPPARTFSTPPDMIVALMSAVAEDPPDAGQLKNVPLDSVSVLPELTTGAETRNVPPATTDKLDTTPPDTTSSVPPLLTVPPLSVPPDST